MYAAAKSKFDAQSRLARYYSEQQVEHARWSEKLETAKLRVNVSNISSLPSIQAVRYEIRVFVSRISPPIEHSARYSFFLRCTLGGLHVFKENLKVCILCNHKTDGNDNTTITSSMVALCLV